MDQLSKNTIQKIIHFAILAALIAALIWLASYLGDVLLPFGVAFLMAYTLNPVVDLLEKKVHNRALAVFLTLTGAALLAGLSLFLLIPPFLDEIARMASLLSRLVTDSDTARRLGQYLPPDLWAAVREQLHTQRLVEILQNGQYLEYIRNALSRILPGAWGLVAGTASFMLGFLGIFVVLLYLFFMLMDYRRFRQDFTGLIPTLYHDEILDFLEAFDGAMNRYFRAQFLVASLVGILFAIGFSIIGMPLGFVFGLLVGAMNMVPYLQVAALPPALLLAILHAVDSGSPIWVAVVLVLAVFAVVQAIQDIILVPRIMGGITGLSPVMMLLSLSVWGKLLGFFGLIVAIPFTCLVLAYYTKLQKGAKAKELERGAGV